MKPSLAILIALTLLAVAVWGFMAGLGFASQRVLTGFDGSVALGCLALLASTGLALWQFDRTKRKEADARIFVQRAPVYQKLVGIMRDLMMAQKGWAPQKDTNEVAKELTLITYGMIVWGGKDTVRALLSLSDGATNPGDMMLRMSDLFKVIRNDLGHSDDAALREDLILQMITAEDRAKVKAQSVEAARSRGRTFP